MNAAECCVLCGLPVTHNTTGQPQSSQSFETHTAVSHANGFTMRKVENGEIVSSRMERVESEAKIEALEDVLQFIASNPGWETDVRDEIVLYIEESICDERALLKLIGESNG